MKRATPILLDTLYALALALWFGLAAGLFVVARPGTPDATQDLFARRAGGLIEAAGVAMVGVQFLLRRRYGRNRQLAVADGVRQLLTFAAFFLAELGRYSLLKPGTPVMVQQFNTLCQLAGVQMLLLTVITAITSWLLVPRSLVGSKAMPAEPGSAEMASPTAPPTSTKPVKPITRHKRNVR